MKINCRRAMAWFLVLLFSIGMIAEVFAEEGQSPEQMQEESPEEDALSETADPAEDPQIAEEGPDEDLTEGSTDEPIEGPTEDPTDEPTEDPDPVYDLKDAVIGPIEVLKYNGTERRPTITVMYGDRTLIEGVDYELIYENNINAGKKARVRVTGIGQYSGSISKYFKIKRVYNKITLSNVTRPYTVRKQSFYLRPQLIDTAAKLTYTSNTTKVKVNSKGKVTIAKEFIGTAKITVTCEETRNAATTTKTIKVTVKAPVLAGKSLVQKYMTKNPKYKAKIPLEVKGLMLHSVNCPQPSALVFIKNWNDPGYTSASIHAFIDANTGEVYQTLPWTIQANHCWKGPKGCGNEMYIGVEMCESSYIEWVRWNKIKCSNKKKARAAVKRTYKSAVDLFAMLCVQFDLDPMKKGVIISHNEGNRMGIASDHGDPENIWKLLGVNYTMDGFRKAVKKAMQKYK